jgi:glycosyltransferase involved in cell wall biosynthesis
MAMVPGKASRHGGRERLGVYFELPYRRDEGGYSTDIAFIRFVLALRPHFESLLLIGRVDPVPGRAPYAVPEDVGMAALPHYASLRDVRGLVAALPATLLAVWRAVGRVDVVWAIGPHPMSIPVALLALVRRKRVVLGVRQDFPRYIRHRLGGRRWAPALAAAYVLEALFRLLARRMPTVAVGPDLARRYRKGDAPILELTVSLVQEADIAAPTPVRGETGARPVELLSVGRLDPEKAPELLLEALARLRADEPNGWRLTIVGEGPLEGELRAASPPLGDVVHFRGHVPNGPELFEIYRASDVFVHVARTEGFPQVLVEAQATALPIVATDVGGVRAGLADGAAALLVPPGDSAALASAIRRLASDAELRERLTALGLRRARGLTLEHQAARVAAFISRPNAPEARDAPGDGSEEHLPAGS